MASGLRRARACIAGVLVVVGATPPSTLGLGGDALAAGTAAGSVSNVVPSSGTISGGTAIVITGTGFSPADGVSFGGAAATNVQVDSSTEIHATTPAHQAGHVVVSVGGSSSGALGFTYVVTDGWLPAQPLTPHRQSFTATTLNDGRVLVAGGAGDAGYLTDSQIFDPSANHGLGAWTTTGPLNTGRAGHTATLLDGAACHSPAAPAYCGKVLVTGGMFTDATGSQPGSSAELFDPATGAWTAVGPMITARANHAATLLNGGPCAAGAGTPPAACGKVLVVGGVRKFPEGTFPVAAAELFDPSTNTWTATGAMATPRFSHTATLLTGSRCREVCGDVLVTGGANNHESFTSTERFDVVAQTWEPAAELAFSRRDHTATALPGEGWIVIIGGSLQTATTEIYDPDPDPGSSSGPRGEFVPGIGRWINADGEGDGGAMTVPRSLHTATLITGSMCSGASPPRQCGKILVTGGMTPAPVDSGGSRSALLFDPAAALAGVSPRWSVSAPMAARRAAHAAVALPDGTVLVAGGGMPADSPFPAAELFDDATARRSPVIAGVSPRVVRSSIKLLGRGLYPAARVRIGGQDAKVTFDSPTEIDAGFTPLVPEGGTASVVASTALGDSPTATVTIGEGSWTDTGRIDVCYPPPGPVQLCEARRQPTSTLLDPRSCHDGTAPISYPCGEVLVAGGMTTRSAGDASPGDTVSRSAELYNPSTGGWTATGLMLAGRVAHSATLLPDGQVLVAGGLTDGAGATAAAELYNPSDGTWYATRGPMTAARSGHTATLIGGSLCDVPAPPTACGEILVAGGEAGSDGTVVLPSSELYDPGTGTWSPVASTMTTARYMHTASLLTDGRVLVTGGLGHPAWMDCDNRCAESQRRSSEIFDPSTARWTDTGDLAVPRSAHTATVLGGPVCEGGTPAPYCGRVLVAGGQGYTPDGPGAILQAELYDLRTGHWEYAGTMPAGHIDATATLLENGNVLIAGSSSGGGDIAGTWATASADIYDPAASIGRGRWRYGGPPSTARGQHTATLLDGPSCRLPTRADYCGKVLVAGGSGALTFDGSCCDTEAPVAMAELYSPAPTILSITPATGPTEGGTSVVLTGTGLEHVRAVTFGGVPAAGFHVDPSGRLTAVSPPHASDERVEVAVVSDGLSSARTFPDPSALFTYTGNPAGCDRPLAPGQVAYQPGYNLVGLPSGTAVPADSYLYGWFDLGGGNRYSVYNSAQTATEGGHGYWAWFACRRSVTVPAAAPQAADLPLAAYHASMIGNPSAAGPVTVTGQDFAARWDPGTNGYRVSGYREPQTLGVGEGMWVFSYVDTSIHIRPQG